jgi:hypothetical protein
VAADVGEHAAAGQRGVGTPQLRVVGTGVEGPSVVHRHLVDRAATQQVERAADGRGEPAVVGDARVGGGQLGEKRRAAGRLLHKRRRAVGRSPLHRRQRAERFRGRTTQRALPQRGQRAQGLLHEYGQADTRRRHREGHMGRDRRGDVDDVDRVEQLAVVGGAEARAELVAGPLRPCGVPAPHAGDRLAEGEQRGQGTLADDVAVAGDSPSQGHIAIFSVFSGGVRWGVSCPAGCRVGLWERRSRASWRFSSG